MSTQSIQGHHFIPQQIAGRYEDLFREFLPGWSVHGEYNLVASSSAPTRRRRGRGMFEVLRGSSVSIPACGTASRAPSRPLPAHEFVPGWSLVLPADPRDACGWRCNQAPTRNQG